MMFSNSKDTLWPCFASALMHPNDFNTVLSCHKIVHCVDFYSVTSKLNFHNREVKSQIGPDSSINHIKATIFVMHLHREFYA